MLVDLRLVAAWWSLTPLLRDRILVQLASEPQPVVRISPACSVISERQPTAIVDQNPAAAGIVWVGTSMCHNRATVRPDRWFFDNCSRHFLIEHRGDMKRHEMVDGAGVLTTFATGRFVVPWRWRIAREARTPIHWAEPIHPQQRIFIYQDVFHFLMSLLLFLSMQGLSVCCRCKPGVWLLFRGWIMWPKVGAPRWDSQFLRPIAPLGTSFLTLSCLHFLFRQFDQDGIEKIYIRCILLCLSWIPSMVLDYNQWFTVFFYLSFMKCKDNIIQPHYILAQRIDHSRTNLVFYQACASFAYQHIAFLTRRWQRSMDKLNAFYSMKTSLQSPEAAMSSMVLAALTVHWELHHHLRMDLASQWRQKK